jgi:hypothetical protein
VWRVITPDNSSNANRCHEGTAANGGVESEEGRHQQMLACGLWIVEGMGMWVGRASRKHVTILFALVIRSAGVLQVAGVFDGDFVADLGDRAMAFLENGLGDAHYDWCA